MVLDSWEKNIKLWLFYKLTFHQVQTDSGMQKVFNNDIEPV